MSSRVDRPFDGQERRRNRRLRTCDTLGRMRIESPTHLLEHLRTLSLAELNEQTERLAAAEHVMVAQLIAHLTEVARRNLHLQLGHRSLFDYCVKRLGLSEGCAALRIQVSRVCCRHPSILDALAEQRITLSVAGKLAPHLTVENCQRLLTDCVGMSKREVEEYLVRLAPKPAVNSGVRKRPAEHPAAALVSESASESTPTSVAPPETPPAVPPRSGSIEPCQPDVYNIRFAAGKGFMAKLVRAAEVGGLGDAHRNLAQVLERALDGYLDRFDPIERQKRRDQRAAPKAAVDASRRVAAPAAERSRSIPTPLRDRLLIRAGHRCEYCGSDGLRCSERSRLEIDHIVPFGRGGASVAANLRVLCVSHNRLHADQCFGAGFMTSTIAAAQRGRLDGDDRSPRPDEVANSDRVCEPAVTYGSPGPGKNFLARVTSPEVAADRYLSSPRCVPARSAEGSGGRPRRVARPAGRQLPSAAVAQRWQ